jgi:hypothetical protein
MMHTQVCKFLSRLAGRGCLIQALDFRKVSIKKAEKKVPLGAIK